MSDDQAETGSPVWETQWNTEGSFVSSSALSVLCLSLTGRSSLHLTFPNLLLQLSRETRLISRAL